jgi:VanZ family protein
VKYLYKYILVLLWMLLIFYLSSEGSDTSSGRSDAIVEVVRNVSSLPNDILTFLTRKAAHITAYFILGVLIYNLVRSYVPRARKAIGASILLVAAYAVTDEFHQLFVPGRSGEVRDVLIDTSAGLVGVVVTFFIIKKYTGRKQAATGKIFKNRV